MSPRDASPAAGPALLRPAWFGYVAGLLLMVAALGVRALLDPILGNSVPLAMLLVAVLFATAIGGWKPGVLVAALGYMAAMYLFVSPRLELKMLDTLGVGGARLALYALSSAAIIGLFFHLRRAQQRHAASEARVMAILETMREGFLAVDAEWRLTAINRSGEATLRQSRPAVLGRTIWETIPGLQGKPAEAALRQAMGDQKVVQFDTDALAPREWHAVTLTPTAGGLSIFVQDVTATRAHVEQLERQVSERTAALQGLVSDLEAFSYTLVHDIRAPLRSISSFSELLAVDHLGQLDHDGRSYLERIRKAAARMDRLITAIMNYSQLARQKPELRPVDLHQLVQEIMDSDPGFQHDKADIGIVGVLPFVRGNESLLSQCFSNLLHNAIKFVAPGVKPRIRISAQVDGDIARVDVTDNGIGITPDAAERIFEPFRREHPGYDGTGIGLAIVRKVVACMEGRVGIVPAAGQGSRFWIELKLAAQPVASAGPQLRDKAVD
jgi:signal transduction histidine kinase